ncbi:PTS sugar transporter subunit IIA [Nocardiopsis changdeensis]|uniref:Mannitol-specific phosphotransferase enzyme IIA component n=1 Tax=Nocardiopsis changdeensis TaxID=2831969 RepID=A0ABX8BMW2_9ACTN|nr:MULTISPECIES: PTS sugar transporter subunit IIA [Nocardiopsis]QKW32118.1 PTS sugar transporter subunit IIA [Nocardiopsis flavescens]QUX23426.1 PTS sugar transporter subunit IIA [Nocardiopsis changdeensis]QYX39368.1 PTS sugar transporter subunit IIA [Nocardiopsis sp. MT53]
MPTEPARLVLTEDAVRLGRTAKDRADVIDQCGELLLELGAVDPGYLPAMHEREASVSTFLGEGVAIPHGTDPSRVHVKRTGLAVIQFPEGVDWGGSTVHVAIGIAATGEEHLGILTALAGVLTDPEKAARLRGATDPADVVGLLDPPAADG